MVAASSKDSLVSSIISFILSLVIFGSLRFYAEWFVQTQLQTLLGGFIGSFIFVFSLTGVSNMEMFVFGKDFQAQFIPEILFCFVLSCIASGCVHRVCGTTCILFSMVGLYFVNRISNKYHSKASSETTEIAQNPRKAGGKKNK